MKSINRGNNKLLAAVLCGSALVAFGAVTVGISQEVQNNVASTGPTAGNASAATTTPTGVVEESVAKAAPAITGKAGEQFGESPNRIP